MAVSRAFAYNTGGLISGLTQTGNLAISGTSFSGLTSSLTWYNGPDETLGYVIAYESPGQSKPGGGTANVQFWRSATQSDASFLSISNYISSRYSTPQNFTDTSTAKTWLNNNGYWTSWISSGGVPIVSDADAQAFLNAAVITDTTQANAINNLVIGLKADSLWTTLDAIYPFVGGTASSHKYNLKDPRDLDAAYRLQFNGGMTHSANGILFNGTNGWADTSGIIFSIDYFGCYTRNASDNGKDYMGSQGSELIDDGDGPYFVYINGFQLARDTFILSSRSGFGSTNNIISTGLSVVTKKTSSGQSVYYKNGIQRGSANNPVFTSAALPPIAIGALNPNSDLSAGTVGIEGYSNQEIAFAFIGNSQLDATQNTNLYNRVQTFQTTLSRQIGTPIPFALPLDTYSGAAVAYSAARRLRTAYTGPLIRVRRSSDNAEQDIGYDANNLLDQSALTAFVGANNGLVVTIYDQSGNSKNATQATAINQPRIVNAGVVDLVNGIPAMLGDGVNDTLINSTLSLTNPSSIFTVVDKVGTSGSFGLYTFSGLSGAFNVLSGGYDFYQNGPSFSPSYSNNNQSLLVAKTATTGTDWELYGNNTTVTNGGQNIGTAIGGIVSLFDRGGTQARCNMYMQEFIVWNSNQMSNRTGIQNNINTFYSIY